MEEMEAKRGRGAIRGDAHQPESKTVRHTALTVDLSLARSLSVACSTPRFPSSPDTGRVHSPSPFVWLSTLLLVVSDVLSVGTTLHTGCRQPLPAHGAQQPVLHHLHVGRSDARPADDQQLCALVAHVRGGGRGRTRAGIVQLGRGRCRRWLGRLLVAPAHNNDGRSTTRRLHKYLAYARVIW